MSLPRGRNLSEDEIIRAYVDCGHMLLAKDKAIRSNDWGLYFNLLEEYRRKYFNEPTDGLNWDNRRNLPLTKA